MKFFHKYHITWILMSSILFPPFVLAHSVQRPMLQCPLGIEVDSYTGNLMLQQNNFYIPDQGLSLDLVFTYNSLSRSEDWGFGNGWMFSYFMSYDDTIDTTGIVILRMDGGKDLFTENGQQYDPPTGISEELEEYQPGKFSLKAKSGITYYFENPNHKKLTKIEEPNGSFIILNYTSSELVSLRDVHGRVISLSWSNGHLTQLTDANDSPVRTYAFEYDGDHNLIYTINPLGDSMKYDYGDQNNLISVENADGGQATIKYNDGMAVQKIQTCFTTQTFKYNLTLGTTYLIEKVGNQDQITTYNFDSQGRLMSQEGNCCGNSSFFTYDQNNKVTKSKDAHGNETIFTYDSLGNVLRETNPLGETIIYTYDPALSRVTSILDRNGNLTSYSYDTKGNVLSVDLPLNISLHYTYNSYGDVLTELNGNGDMTKYFYDQYGYIESVEDPLNQRISFVHDVRGNMTGRTDKNGKTFHYAYDKLNRVTSIEDPLGGMTFYEYDASGNLTKIKDVNGFITTYEYDELGRQIKIKDALGHEIILSRNANDNVTALTDPRNNSTTFTYNHRNLLTSVTDALGNTKSVTYDLNNNVISFTDAKGNTYQPTYDALNRMVSITDPHGQTFSAVFDPNGNITKITDRINNSTHLVYDELDRLIEIKDAVGKSRYMTYDNNGNKLSETDANGHSTIFKYDKLDRLIEVVDPKGNSALFEYDAMDNIIRKTDPNGNEYRYSFDALNRQDSLINPEGDLTLFYYDATSNIRDITTPYGNHIHYTRDSTYRLTEVSDDLGTINIYKYDKVGNLIEKIDANQHATQYTYDAINRLTSVEEPEGTSIQIAYDRNSNITSYQDRNRHTTLYMYDELNRNIQEIDPLGKTTLKAYNPEGDIISITDANTRTTHYSYDPLRRIIEEKFADFTRVNYTYDAVGNLLSRIDNNRDTVAFKYDSLNRLIYQDFPGSNDDRFTYDKLGRMLTAANSHANISFVYDKADRVISESLNGKVTTYSHDIPGRSLTVTYPGGRQIRREMNVRGQLLNVHDGTTNLVTYQYDPADRPSTLDFGINGTSVNYTYDANDRMTSIQHNPSQFVHIDYILDSEGNNKLLHKLHYPETSEEFRYDGLDQVTDYRVGIPSAGQIPSPATETILSYDAVHNRLTSSKNGLLTTYSSNVMNGYEEITETTTEQLYYDLNGNLLSNGTQAYQYDFYNRIISIDNGTTASYKYDPLGRRIQKITPSETVNYYYAGDQVIEEQDGIGTVEATYVYGTWLDDILSMRRGAADYYFHNNSLGSVVAVTNSSGSVVERYEYDAFGKPTIYDNAFIEQSSSAINNPYLFTGRRWDRESELYYFRARHYNPELGKFQTRDRLGYIDGMNLYTAYFAPNGIDPTGLRECDCKNKNGCKGLKDARQKLNKFVNKKIQFAKSNYKSTLMAVIHDSDDYESPLDLFWDMVAEDDPTQFVLPFGFIPLASTHIENEIIFNWSDEYRKSNYHRKGKADCIKITCPYRTQFAFTRSYCIGTDKIGHFFQQGHQGYEIWKEAGLDSDAAKVLGKGYLDWTEGLYKPTKQNEHITNWLKKGYFTFKVYGDKPFKLSKDERRYGDIRQPIPLYPWFSIDIQIAVASPQDQQANFRGMDWWKKYHNNWNNPDFKFDICDHVSDKWVE